MRLFCLLLIFSCSTTFAQPDSARSVVAPDSFDTYQITDSLARIESREQMNQNLSYFVAEQQKRDKKLKQQTILRIALGLLMLVVLVIGIKRRSRKKQ